MSENKKVVKTLVCPACFAREIDFMLAYDEEDEEYYCQKCCYAGKEEDIQRFYKHFTQEKYKEMAKQYPEEKEGK